MILWIPGFIQFRRRRYLEGAAVFLLVTFPILWLLRGMLFPFAPLRPWEPWLWSALSLAGIAWHAAFAVRCRAGAETSAAPPESPESLYEKGRMAGLRGNHELARMYYESLKKIRPDDKDVDYQLGKTCIELGEIDRAVRLFRDYLNKPGGRKKWRREIEDLYEEYRQR